MPKYTVRHGFSFKEADGSLKTGGQTIELELDMAALHADKIDPLVDAPTEVQPPAQDAPHE